MDVKMQRYMQRIEKLISTPKNNVGLFRPSKSPLSQKPNQLDRYLKYELSIKIINNIVTRHKSQLVMVFFNMIRNSDYRQKEKIYKFVAIQRKDVKVDLGVAAKLLIAVVKQLLKKQFSRFLLNLQIDSPLLSPFNKLTRYDTINSVELPRTSSLNNQSKVKNLPQQIQDMETEQQKALVLKKINAFKDHTAKMILKLINQNFLQMQKKVFQNIKFHSILKQSNLNKSRLNQSKIWQQKQKNYLAEIQKLSERLSKCQSLLLKQSTLKMNEIAKNKLTQTSNNSKLAEFYITTSRFFNRKIDKEKYRFLQQTINIILSATLNKQRHKKPAKNCNILEGHRKILMLVNKRCRQSLQKIRQVGFKKQRNSYVLIVTMIQLHNKRKNQSFSFFFRSLLVYLPIQKSCRNYEQLRLNRDFESSSNKPFNVSNKNISKISTLTRSEEVGPMKTINFHLFVDKIFKLTLILGKLLIPLKQSFDKINQYALYSYEIQEKFKEIALKNIRQSFVKLATFRKSDARKQLPLEKLMVIQGLIRERLVESFSHIKIISKKNNLMMKLFPVKLHIVDMTKQFIEQRMTYSQNSLSNWSRLRQDLYQDAKGVIPQQNQKKKKAIR